MRKLHNLILSGALMPRKKSHHNILKKIDSMQVPIVANKKHTPPTNNISFNYLHYDNRCTIEHIAFYLKQEFLHDVDINEIFDTRSQIHQVYISLTKLDKIKLINNHYLDERNIHGLRKLSESLNAIVYE